MPRKKVTNNTQSSGPRQPTLAGFINSKSASMVNPSAGPQPVAKTTTTPKQSKPAKPTTSIVSASKSQTKSTSTAEPKIGPPASKRRSGAKSGQTKSPKKKVLARQENSSGDSGEDSDPAALRAIRFESQEEGTHTEGSTIELTSSGEEEEDQIISPPRLKRTATQKKRALSGSPSDSDVELIGGSAGAPRKVKRRLKRRLMSSDEGDPTETEEEEEGSSPKKRRLVKGLKPSTSEEEIDLMDEVDEHRECRPSNGDYDYSLEAVLIAWQVSLAHVCEHERRRLRSSEASKHLNVRCLHRVEFYYPKCDTGQRSGLSVESPNSFEEEEDEEDELLSEPPRAGWDFFKPFAGAKPSKDAKSDEEVEDESDDGGKVEEEGEGGEDGWIVEDDGLEGVPELPTAFNMSSHQDLSHHFKIVCQLFVHLAVRSPSQRVSFIQDVKAGKHLRCVSLSHGYPISIAPPGLVGFSRR